MTETCPGLKRVDLTDYRFETVLRTVTTLARTASVDPFALELFALLRSMGQEGKHYSFSKNFALSSKGHPPPS